MEVPYNEGVANHIGPESCVECPPGTGEALTGVRVGQPLSGERSSGVPMLSDRQKATRRGAIMRVPCPTPRRLRPWHARTLLVRKPGDLRRRPWGPTHGPHREGTSRSR